MEHYTSSFVRKAKNGKSYRKCLRYKDESGAWKVVSATAEASGIREAKKEAEVWRHEMNANYEAEHDPRTVRRKEAAEQTVGEYVRAYLDARAADGTIDQSTVMDYRKSLRDIANPEGGIGAVEINRLEPQDIRAWHTWMLSDERNLSVSTAIKRHALLKMALSQAVIDGSIPHSPAEGVKRPKKRGKQEPNALTPESVGRVREWLAHADPTPFATSVALALYIGMRRQECAALMWKDIDFNGDAMKICRALGEGAGGTYIKDPKNHEARIVPVTEPVRVVISRRLEEVKRDLATPIFSLPLSELYVCGEPDGSYGRMWSITRKWKMLREILNLEGVTRKEVVFHDLRHTFATYTIHAGMDIVTVSHILGHKSVKMTLDVYAAALPNAIREAAPEIASALEVGKLELPEYVRR